MFSKDTGWKAALTGVVGLAAVMVLSSCSDFSVRPSEPPSGGGTVWVLPQEPSHVLSNLINVTNALDPLNYAKLLAEDFVFVPDPSDAINLENYYPGVFLDWTADVEKTVTEHILDESRTGFALLSFANENIIEETDSTHIVQEDYSLILQMGTLESYMGSVRFFMRRRPDDGLWYIYRWEDSQLPEAEVDTWGVLKGVIRASL